MTRRGLAVLALATWGLGPRGALALEPTTEVEASEPPTQGADEADEADEGDEDAYVRAVVGRAAAHVDAGRFDRALAVLDEAERERPLPVFIYVRATIEERRGQCERAAELYREFLEHDVPEADAEEARRGVLRCRPELAGGPAVDGDADHQADDDVGEEEEDDDDVGEEEVEPARPWSADPVGASLVIAGVAGVGVGLGLYAQSRADERASHRASTLQDFEDSSRRAVALNRAGITVLAVGSALIVGGAVRYAVVGARTRRRARLSASLAPGRAGLLLHWRF